MKSVLGMVRFGPVRWQPNISINQYFKLVPVPIWGQFLFRQEQHFVIPLSMVSDWAKKWDIASYRSVLICMQLQSSWWLLISTTIIPILCNYSHYSDVIMGTIASQITSLTIVYSTVYSGADQRKHQSSASLAFVWGIHRGPVNSPHKAPVTRKMIPFDDVIMVAWQWPVQGVVLREECTGCTKTPQTNLYYQQYRFIHLYTYLSYIMYICISQVGIYMCIVKLHVYIF